MKRNGRTKNFVSTQNGTTTLVGGGMDTQRGQQQRHGRTFRLCVRGHGRMKNFVGTRNGTTTLVSGRMDTQRGQQQQHGRTLNDGMDKQKGQL